MDIGERIIQLALEGYECSQILVILALEADGSENPDLVRALGALSGGIGHCQKECGALTGGCCAIGYLLGGRGNEEMEDDSYNEVLSEYINWFSENFAVGESTYCRDMIGEGFSSVMTNCMPLLEECANKLMQLIL